jgi:hypothetical protein
VQRAMAARNEYVAQNAFYIGGFMYLVFGMVPVNLLPRVHSQPSEKLKLQVARWSIPFMAVIALYTVPTRCVPDSRALIAIVPGRIQSTLVLACVDAMNY